MFISVHSAFPSPWVFTFTMFGRYLFIVNPDAWLEVDYGGRVFFRLCLYITFYQSSEQGSYKLFIKLHWDKDWGCPLYRLWGWEKRKLERLFLMSVKRFKLFQCLISLSYQAPNLCLLFSQVPFPHFDQPCFVVLLELVDGVMQPLTLRHNFIESGIICFVHLDNLAFLFCHKTKHLRNLLRSDLLGILT